MSSIAAQWMGSSSPETEVFIRLSECARPTTKGKTAGPLVVAPEDVVADVADVELSENKKEKGKFHLPR